MIAGVALSGFVCTHRVHHDDFTPQSGITELCWGRGRNFRTLVTVDLGELISIIRNIDDDDLTQSSPLPVSMYL